MADAEKLLPTELLRTGYPKINRAIDNSNTALSKATTAETKSTNAVNTANSVQTQLDAVVTRETDSDAMSAQAAVNAHGVDRGNLKVRLDEDYTEVSDKLNTIPKFPILSAEGTSVVRTDLPYGHVDRYGAVASDSSLSNVVDSSAAFQKAADIVLAMSKGIGVWAAGAFTFLMGSGTYTVTKTTNLFYDKVLFSKDAAFNVKGQYKKKVADKLGIGTTIRPLIPNHDGKSYATVFSINIKYNSDTDEADEIAFDTLPLQTINSITFEDVSFTLTDEEALTYNICAIKGYRFRIDAKNLIFTNMWRWIWQPEKDVNNLYNYCDFCKFDTLSGTYTKHTGIELYTADCTSIKHIYNHRPKSTFDSLLKLTRGSYTIDDVTHSLHGDYDSNGTFVPRNDGTGQTGTKAIFKLKECAVSIRDVYCERPLTDYVFHLTDVINFSLDDYKGKFVGNGFMSINGTCRNLHVINVLRNENIVSEYTDYYVAAGASFTGLVNKNFVPRNYYSNSISLATPLTGLTAYAESNFTTRDIKHNFTFAQAKFIEGEQITFKLMYDGTNWITRDLQDNDLTNTLGTFTWSTDGITFAGTKIAACKILHVGAGYVSSTVLPHEPIPRGLGTDKIRFFDRTTGQAVSTPDTKCCALITVSAVLNMTKLPA